MNLIRFLFITLLMATAALPSRATDYFASTRIGNDRLDGHASATNGTSGPFASLKALESIALHNGDRIFLRCGDRFTGPLHLTLNNQTPGELTIGSFGDCTAENRPIIDGRVPLTNAATGQQQQFTESAPIEQVFAGDKTLTLARYPANGYLILPVNTTASAMSLPADASFVNRPLNGAQLHARTQEWFIEERAIVTAGGQLDSALQYPLRPKVGIYLTGKPWMIGVQPAWCYDANEKTLTVRAMQNDLLSKVPSGHLFQVNGHGSLSVTGINFDAAGGDAINTHLDGIVSIKDVGIRRAIGNGISIGGAKNAFVISSSITDVGLDAIFFAETKRVFVKRNRVTNAGLYGGPRPSLGAINAHRTESATIDENIVENSAYHGIRFSGDARIRRNYVSQSCLLLSDCASIYTWRRNATDRRPHSEIVGNLIIGASGDTTVKLGVNDWFAGIYLDEFSNDILVESNIIAGVNQGIYLHNAYNNEVRNNVVRAHNKTLIDAADKSKFPVGASISNTIHSNSERIGAFKAVISDHTGKKKSFDFDEDVTVNLALQVSNADQKISNHRCTPESELVISRMAKNETAFTAAVNCD